MADTSRERTGEFVQKLFEILIANPDGLQARDAIEALGKKFTLTPYEEGEYASGGGRRFDKIVRFATVDCAKAGWLLKQSGTWSITESGKAAYKTFKNPGDLYKEAARLYRAWKLGQSEKAADTPDVALEEALDKNTSVTFEEAEDQARTEVQDYLSKINPYEFQDLIASLIKAMGYYVSWNAPPGKDGGVDIIAHPDALGTKPPRIKVQVKRNSDRIAADGVRAFLALINEDDVGLYVALGGFTKDAEDFARNQERRKVTLINLDRFHKLWIENYPRLSDAARKRFPLSPIWFLTPSD
jgi:restriction system protein